MKGKIPKGRLSIRQSRTLPSGGWKKAAPDLRTNIVASGFPTQGQNPGERLELE